MFLQKEISKKRVELAEKELLTMEIDNILLKMSKMTIELQDKINKEEISRLK